MSTLIELLQAAKRASRIAACASTEQKNTAIVKMADALIAQQDRILAANANDMQQAQAKNISAAMQDRLLLNPARIQSMANALRDIVALPDPVNIEREFTVRPNGIKVYKRRIALGVIAMIYEARPNVCAEAGALCLKAGNACVLRGGSEAFQSNQAIAAVLHEALREAGFPTDVIMVMPTTDRQDLLTLLQQDQLIDLVIPRGGEGLIRFVAENSRIPVIKHFKGVCHLYVDKTADEQLAINLLLDGKVSRPAVCNSLETLLVHRDCAATFMPKAIKALRDKHVEVLGCERTRGFDNAVVLASDDDYAAEFLDLKITIKIVDSADDAIAHIARFGSQHTEVIASNDAQLNERFVREVDASSVMVNASSRFNDGGELGLGSEIGIATTKLHAYGPMGLESLTAEKFVVRGEGQIRHPIG